VGKFYIKEEVALLKISQRKLYGKVVSRISCNVKTTARSPTWSGAQPSTKQNLLSGSWWRWFCCSAARR